MKKIFDKWYLSMFIIPIVVTYLTNYIELPTLFANWEYSIITSMTILIGILLYEMLILNGELTKLQERPKNADKRIVRELLKILNIDSFHEEIVRQDAWNGYYHEDIDRILEFMEKAQLIGYKTSSGEVNLLIQNFVFTLEEFTNYSSERVYRRGDYLIPFKENPDIHPHEKIRLESDKMNKLTQKSFLELEKLMKVLREKEYV